MRLNYTRLNLIILIAVISSLAIPTTQALDADDPIHFVELGLGEATGGDYGAWTSYNITNSVNVERGSVAVILAGYGQGGSDTERYVGVRAEGSSVDRRIDTSGISTATNGDHYTLMLVEVDATGQIEYYKENNHCRTRILGYFNGSMLFEEAFHEVTPLTQTGWQDLDAVTELSAYSVSAGDILMFTMSVTTQDTDEYIGVRSGNTTIDKSVYTTGGMSASANMTCTFFAVVNATGYVQYLCDDNSAQLFYMGRLSCSDANVDLRFTDAKEDLSISTGWTDNDLTAYNPLANATVVITFGTSDGGLDKQTGIRENGSAVDRKLDQPRYANTGIYPITGIVNIDEQDIFEDHGVSAGTNGKYYYMGYFWTTPAPSEPPPSVGTDYLMTGMGLFGIVLMLWSGVSTVRNTKRRIGFLNNIEHIFVAMLVFIFGIALFYMWVTML